MKRKVNQKLISQLSEVGLAAAVNDGALPNRGYDNRAKYTALIQGNFSAAKRLVDGVDALTWNHNKEKALGSLRATNNGWRGGSFKQLTAALKGDLPLTPFIAAKDKFAKGQLAEKLKTKLADVMPRRKRVLAEHDGQWEMDRQWEITPFTATTRAMGSTRFVDIVVHVAFSAGVDADDINRYGAAVWGVSQAIEDAGIQTSITYAMQGLGNSSDGEVDAHARITLKKSGEYISPNVLAGAFTGNFYRRFMFVFYPLCADIAEKEVSHGFGGVPNFPNLIEFKDGQLHVYPRVVGNWGNFDDDAEREVLKAIGAK